MRRPVESRFPGFGPALAGDYEMSMFGFLDDGRDGARFEAPDVRPVDVAERCVLEAPVVVEDGGCRIALAGRPRFGELKDPQSVARGIAAAWRTEGTRALPRLRGRFALSIVEPGARRVVLAVDRIGVERLTWAHSAGTFAFGTSAERVARTIAGSPRLDAQALFDYVLLHMVPSPGTVFAGVHKLRPGTCVTLERGTARVERWWNPTFSHGAAPEFGSLRDELRAGLHAAVANCDPDASTGAFLSGGLDSSTVAGVLRDVSGRAPKTFSIGFGYPDYDELPYARVAQRAFGAEAHEYVVHGDDIAATFATIARMFDEPFGNSSALPVYYCAKLARERGVDHLLAGDGGDELFAGNSRYVEQQVFELWNRVPGLVRRGLIQPVVAAWPDALAFHLVRRARGYIEKASIPLPARLEAYNLVRQLGAEAFFTADFRASVDPDAPLRAMQAVWDSTPGDDYLQHMLWYDWQYTLSDNDLRKVETMSAAAGVRVSYPMLDDGLVEFSMRVPPDVLMPGRQLRGFYKRAMAGYLPDEIINKKKHGFGLPFGLWLQESEPLRRLVMGNLESLRDRRVIRDELIERLLHLHGSEDARFYGVFVWVLAMLEQWFQEHRVSP
jgi:asparagine synthase (glutamine-hydrolysing)